MSNEVTHGVVELIYTNVRFIQRGRPFVVFSAGTDHETKYGRATTAEEREQERMLGINGAMDAAQRRVARRRIEEWKSAATKMRMDIEHPLKSTMRIKVCTWLRWAFNIQLS